MKVSIGPKNFTNNKENSIRIETQDSTSKNFLKSKLSPSLKSNQAISRVRSSPLNLSLALNQSPYFNDSHSDIDDNNVSRIEAKRQSELIKQLTTMRESKLCNEQILRKQIKELEDKIRLLVSPCKTQKFMEENKNLQQKISKLQAANKQLQIQLKSACETRNEACKELSKIKLEIGSKMEVLNTRIESLYQSEHYLTEQNQILKLQNESLSNESIKSIKINEMLKSIIFKYEQNYDEKTKELSIINKKYQYLLTEYQRNQARSNGYREPSKALTSLKYSRSRDKITSFNCVEGDQQMGSMNPKKSMIESLMDEIDNLDLMNSQLKHKICQLNSTKHQSLDQIASRDTPNPQTLSKNVSRR